MGRRPRTWNRWSTSTYGLGKRDCSWRLSHASTATTPAVAGTPARGAVDAGAGRDHRRRDHRYLTSVGSERDPAEIGLGVARAWRGRGVGTRLVATAIEWGHSRGVQSSQPRYSRTTSRHSTCSTNSGSNGKDYAEATIVAKTARSGTRSAREASRRGQTEKAARKRSSPGGPLGYKSGAAGGYPAPLVSVIPRRRADHSPASRGTEFPFGPAGVLASDRAPQYSHRRHPLAASARQSHRPFWRL